MIVPDKYLFSKRFSCILEKAKELGYDGFDHYPGIKDIHAHGYACTYDVSMDNLFDAGVPGAFAGVDDPMGEYLGLQLTAAIVDLATYCVREGKLPRDTYGLEVTEIDGTITVLVKPEAYASVLGTILSLR